MSRISKQTEVLGGVYRSMIDMTPNDVHTFKEWCDENGFEDVFHDKFNSQHF